MSKCVFSGLPGVTKAVGLFASLDVYNQLALLFVLIPRRCSCSSSNPFCQDALAEQEDTRRYGRSVFAA